MAIAVTVTISIPTNRESELSSVLVDSRLLMVASAERGLDSQTTVVPELDDDESDRGVA